jgi:hypothetical protein
MNVLIKSLPTVCSVLLFWLRVASPLIAQLLLRQSQQSKTFLNKEVFVGKELKKRPYRYFQLIVKVRFFLAENWKMKKT